MRPLPTTSAPTLHPRKLPFLLSALPLLLPAGLAGQAAWTYNANGAIYSSVGLLPDGGLVVGVGGADPRVLCLTSGTSSATLRWTFRPAGGADWFDSSPAIAPDGTVYIGSWDNYVYALNGATGTQKWRFLTGSLVLASPALAADGTVYVASTDGYLYALDPAKGTAPEGPQKWAYDIGDQLESSPAVGRNGTVYVGAYDGYLYAFNPDGTLRWQFQAAVIEGKSNRLAGSPAIDEDDRIYFGSGNGEFYCVEEVDGAPVQRWKFTSSEELDSSPVIGNDGNIYLGGRNGYFYCLTPDGQLFWENDVGDIFFSGPAVAENGVSYIPAYTGDNTTALYAFNADGFQQFARTMNATGKTNIVDASPAVANDGRIYLGSYNGLLYCFEPPLTIGNPASYLAQSGWPRFGHDNRQSGRATLAPIVAAQELTVARLNGPLSVEAKVAGDGPFTATWRRGGTVVATGPETSFRKAAATSTDIGFYDVFVENAVGQFAPRNASAPLILLEPMAISGTGTLTLQQTYWRPANLGGWTFAWEQGGPGSWSGTGVTDTQLSATATAARRRASLTTAAAAAQLRLRAERP